MPNDTNVPAGAVADPSRLEINKGDQFIVALDISGSMNTQDCKGGTSRLAYTLETVKTFCAEAAKFDPDGVSIYLFGASCHAFPDMKPEDIDAKLSGIKTESMTRTDLAINAAYAEHKSKGSKQTFLLCFTDGEPADQEAVEKAIIAITKDVKDPLEFRIGLLTVGERSPSLRKWLVDLDDNLTSKGAAHDIVDVKTMDEVDFIAAVNGALTD